MVKDTPEVLKLLKRFENQEHRIEINDCEILYNGKSFFLGNTLEEVETILGKPDLKDEYGAMWYEIKLDIRIDKKSRNSNNIYTYLAKGYKENMKPNNNVVLFNGIPITKEMTFGKFISNSKYTFDDFNINRSFEFRPSGCDLKELYIYFNSSPTFNYSGGGHLQVRGSFDPNKTEPIDYISIFQEKS